MKPTTLPLRARCRRQPNDRSHHMEIELVTKRVPFMGSHAITFVLILDDKSLPQVTLDLDIARTRQEMEAWVQRAVTNMVSGYDLKLQGLVAQKVAEAIERYTQ